MTLRYFFILIAALPMVACSPSGKGAKPSDAKALGKQLMSNLPGIFSLDTQTGTTPSIRNGDWIIGMQPIPLVESFSANTHAIATLFVKVGDEFIRLSTTEINERPGTRLDHGNPAYRNLFGELRWTGEMTLSGKDYMVDYDVFRDRQGRVIGAYLVGIPL